MKCSIFERGLSVYFVKNKKQTSFVKSEAKAIEAIAAFKIELTSSKRSLEYFEKLYEDCSFIEGKRLTGCPFHTDFYVFFEELLEASKKYRWKRATKKKAVALAASYVRFQLKEPQNLASALYLAEIFKLMGRYGYLKKDISKEIKTIISELNGEKNKQFQDLTKNGIRNCEKALQNFHFEVATGKTYVEKMRAWEVTLP